MRKTQQSSYDYSVLVSAAKKESVYKDFSEFIDEKIKECRREYHDDEAKCLNRFTLAKMIGINPSTLTKIINGSQKTRKRDIIIALCFALKMSESDTQMALNLYPMVPLNPNNMRDLVIINALHKRVTVRELDNILDANNVPRLNILRGEHKKDIVPFYYSVKSDEYVEEPAIVLPYRLGGDAELALHERYRPDLFDYHSEMVIQKQGDDGTKYRIVRDEDGQYEIELWKNNEWKCLYSDDRLRQKYDGVKQCEDPGLLNEIAKLKHYTDNRARYIHGMCDDTRFYGSRLNAEIDNMQIVIYGESFGNDAPEFCEYYQLKVSDEGCLFTVSHSSRFLGRYLGKEEYMRLYGKEVSLADHSYNSLGEVSDQRWRVHFQTLLDSASELLRQIRERKLYLFNAHAYLEIDELMHIFHVEDAFDCYQPEGLHYKIVPRKDRIIGPDGRPITIEDLYRAAELRVFSLDEFCEIRQRYGSFDQYLQMDTLTEQKG